METHVDDLEALLRRILWNRQAREKLQQHGINVVPSNYYSSVPSVEEVVTSYEYVRPEPPYLIESIFDSTTLDRTLEELTAFSGEFDPPLDGPEDHPQRFFWRNSQFSFSDAMSYYCFIRRNQPRRIVEIGSGFSTLVGLEAVNANGGGAITCVEPFPRTFLREQPVELLETKAQELDADFMNRALDHGDVLFIDSTHTVKTGSDCLHIYLRLLPRIKKNILVHVHDVFLPFGLPVEWLLDQQIYWTEQYLLLAWLIENPYARVVYGSNYHHKFNKTALDRMMHGRFPSGGGSFWIEYRGGDRVL